MENEHTDEAPALPDVVNMLSQVANDYGMALGALSVYQHDLDQRAGETPQGQQRVEIVTQQLEALQFSLDEMHLSLASLHLYLSGRMIAPQYFHDEDEDADDD